MRWETAGRWKGQFATFSGGRMGTKFKKKTLLLDDEFSYVPVEFIKPGQFLFGGGEVKAIKTFVMSEGIGSYRGIFVAEGEYYCEWDDVFKAVETKPLSQDTVFYEFTMDQGVVVSFGDTIWHTNGKQTKDFLEFTERQLEFSRSVRKKDGRLGDWDKDH